MKDLETAWFVRCAAALPEIGPRFFRIVCIAGVLRELQSLVEPPDCLSRVRHFSIGYEAIVSGSCRTESGKYHELGKLVTIWSFLHKSTIL